MTVNPNIPVSGPLTADGVNRNWTFGFKITDAAHMRLRITDADGVSNPLVVTSGFTIAPQYIGQDSGGVVVYPTAPTTPVANTRKVFLYREAPYEQASKIGNQGGFFPKTHETALDLLGMQIQQLNERLSRAAVVPIGSSTGTEDLVAAIEALGSVSAQIIIVAGISSQVQTVAGIAANVTTVAGIASNVTTVAGIAAAISTIAPISANITTVAGNIAAVNTAATNIAAIIAAPTAATNASTSASAAATSATAAANSVAALGYNFDTATTDADPGSGNLRLNNAAPGSATAAYIDNTNADAVNVTGILDSWDDISDTANRGTLVIGAKGNAAIRYYFRVTGNVVDGTGYRKLTLTPLGGTGALTAAMPVWAIFTPAGAKGADGLGSGDVVGPASAVNNNIAVYDTTTGKLIKDGGVAISSLAPVNNASFTGTFSTAAGAIARSNLTNGSATSVIGRSANSGGAVNDIAAASNDTFLQRVSNALSWGGLTIGMVADGLLTYVKLASGAIATTSEWLSNTASKLLTPAAVWGAMAEVTLTDAATVAWDLSTGFDFVLTATSGVGNSRTLGNPTNVKVGQRGRIRYVQDATGGRALLKNTNHKTPGGAALSIATTASSESFIYYDCVSSTKILLSNSPLAWS